MPRKSNKDTNSNASAGAPEAPENEKAEDEVTTTEATPEAEKSATAESEPQTPEGEEATPESGTVAADGEEPAPETSEEPDAVDAEELKQGEIIEGAPRSPFTNSVNVGPGGLDEKGKVLFFCRESLKYFLAPVEYQKGGALYAGPSSKESAGDK